MNPAHTSTYIANCNTFCITKQNLVSFLLKYVCNNAKKGFVKRLYCVISVMDDYTINYFQCNIVFFVLLKTNIMK